MPYASYSIIVFNLVPFIRVDLLPFQFWPTDNVMLSTLVAIFAGYLHSSTVYYSHFSPPNWTQSVLPVCLMASNHFSSCCAGSEYALVVFQVRSLSSTALINASHLSWAQMRSLLTWEGQEQEEMQSHTMALPKIVLESQWILSENLEHHGYEWINLLLPCQNWFMCQFGTCT